MTAPLFHLSPGALDGVDVGADLHLDGDEGHHAVRVMRLQVGEEIVLSDTCEMRVTGVVSEVSEGALTLVVHHVSRVEAVRPRLVLVQALAKDRRDIQAVESCTELGVDAVIPWEAQRSVVRWKSSREAKKHAEWVSTVRTAAKQTRRTDVPEVLPLHTTAQYCRLVAEMSSKSQRRAAVLVLHESAWDSLADQLDRLQAPQCEELHLLVGPEGGVASGEIEELVEAGASVARLGPSVLRSSTAGPAAVTAVQVLLGRWDRLSDSSAVD